MGLKFHAGLQNNRASGTLGGPDPSRKPQGHGSYTRTLVGCIVYNPYLAISVNRGVLFVGVLRIRALVFGVYIRALDFSEPHVHPYYAD